MTLLRPSLAKPVNSLCTGGVERIQKITKRGERAKRGEGDGKTPTTFRVRLTPPAGL